MPRVAPCGPALPGRTAASRSLSNWPDTVAAEKAAQGDRKVWQALRKTLYVRVRLRDQALFERAHEYIREYY